ncbi:unnamed protein product, partial [marine sediment metagenome]
MAGIVQLAAWSKTLKKYRLVLSDEEGRLLTVISLDSLNDIGDVDVAAPADNEILYWNDGNSKWEVKALWTAAHKNTHDPEDGADKLDTAAPVKIGEA